MRKVIIGILLLVLCAQGWAEEEEEKWQEYKTMHFIIYHQGAPRRFLENVKESAEEYYGDITRDLGFTRYQGWSFDRRAKIYIFRDRDHYVAMAKQAKWTHGTADTYNKIIRTFPSSYGFFDSILPHELGHIIFREFIGFRAKIPLWIEEGVAMYQEKGRRWGANEVVRKAMESGSFMTLMEMSRMKLTSSTDKDLIDLFYAESASIVQFMIDDMGEHRFLRFCRELKDGSTFERALHQSYSRIENTEDLNKLWMDYLKE